MEYIPLKVNSQKSIEMIPFNGWIHYKFDIFLGSFGFSFQFYSLIVFKFYFVFEYAHVSIASYAFHWWGRDCHVGLGE